MPLLRCTRNGKSGYKWGSEGFCYTTANAKELALKQGQAIEAQKHRDNKNGSESRPKSTNPD